VWVYKSLASFDAQCKWLLLIFGCVVLYIFSKREATAAQENEVKLEMSGQFILGSVLMRLIYSAITQTLQRKERQLLDTVVIRRFA
jgi:hypothetical protein